MSIPSDVNPSNFANSSVSEAFHSTTLLSMCFDCISFAHLHLAKQKVQSHWLNVAVTLAKTTLPATKRPPRRKGWTNTTLKRSQAVPHLCKKLSTAPPCLLADELLTERLPPHWMKLSDTKIPPAARRKNYLAAKMHPKTRYFLQGLEMSENNTGQQRVQTSANFWTHQG